MKRIPLPLWIVSVLLYVFMYAPIVVVIVFSFNAAKHGGPWLGFTTEGTRPCSTVPARLPPRATRSSSAW
jgi:ABC-type spermidine/putrescine transport system permease subunit II